MPPPKDVVEGKTTVDVKKYDSVHAYYLFFHVCKKKNKKKNAGVRKSNIYKITNSVIFQCLDCFDYIRMNFFSRP